MSVALVTSATSAMRPCIGDRERALAHHARDLGDRRSARRAATASAKSTLPRVDGAPSASAMPWYTSTAAMPSTSRSTNSARRPSTDVGSERTRNVASSAIDEHERRVLRPTPARASTTMNANEIGSAARSGGLQLDQLAGRDGAADERERRPRAARVGDLDPDRDRRAPEHEDEQPRPASHDPAACSSGTSSSARGDRGRPSRCRLPAEPPPTRARRPRGRRRSARRGVRSRR